MKFLIAVVLLAVSCASAGPAFRDVTCPDVGLMCLDSNTYTYCINLGVMKIVGSTAYSCPAGFVCDHSTTTPCIAEKKNIAIAAQKSFVKERGFPVPEEDNDDLIVLAATTLEPDSSATTLSSVSFGNKKIHKAKGSGKKH